MTHIEKLKRLAEKWGNVNLIHHHKNKHPWIVESYGPEVYRRLFTGETPEECVDIAHKSEFGEGE